MNIKEVSQRTDVSADTIRYYERIGLIPAVKRHPNGIRNFDDEDIRWIQFARQMRNAGVSIEGLIEYLILFRKGDTTVDARLELLVDQKNELQERIDLLEEAKSRLAFKIDNYKSHVMKAEKNLRMVEADE